MSWYKPPSNRKKISRKQYDTIPWTETNDAMIVGAIKHRWRASKNPKLNKVDLNNATKILVNDDNIKVRYKTPVTVENALVVKSDQLSSKRRGVRFELPVREDNEAEKVWRDALQKATQLRDIDIDTSRRIRKKLQGHDEIVDFMDEFPFNKWSEERKAQLYAFRGDVSLSLYSVRGKTARFTTTNPNAMIDFRFNLKRRSGPFDQMSDDEYLELLDKHHTTAWIRQDETLPERAIQEMVETHLKALRSMTAGAQIYYYFRYLSTDWGGRSMEAKPLPAEEWSLHTDQKEIPELAPYRERDAIQHMQEGAEEAERYHQRHLQYQISRPY